MASIEDLKKVDLTKVELPEIKKEIEELLDELGEEDKEALSLKDAKESINILHSLVEQLYPAALPEAIRPIKKPVTPKDEKPKNTTPKAGAQDWQIQQKLTEKVMDELDDLANQLEGEEATILETTAQELSDALDKIGNLNSFGAALRKAVRNFWEWEGDLSDAELKKKAITAMDKLAKALGIEREKKTPKPKPVQKKSNKEALEQFKAHEPKLENCRRVIREHNAKKREQEGAKPKKTRHTQLKDKMLSVAGLIPDKFKDEATKLAETEAILLTAYRKLIAAWEMDKVKSKSGEEAIKDKLDGYLEKSEKEDRKKLAKRWRDQLPELEQVMRKEWKESEELEAVAKEMLENFKTSTKMFEENPSEALKFLKNKYSDEQLETHLPMFVQIALGIKQEEKSTPKN